MNEQRHVPHADFMMDFIAGRKDDINAATSGVVEFRIAADGVVPNFQHGAGDEFGTWHPEPALRDQLLGLVNALDDADLASAERALQAILDLRASRD